MTRGATAMRYPGRRYVGGAVLAILLCGCGTTMVVTPPMEQVTTGDFAVHGKVLYDGNREYLPRTIIDRSGERPGLTFQYTYDVLHGKDNVPQALPLFNPLTMLGFPIGEDTLVVVGRLEVSRGGEVAKAYTATCGFEKTRSLFYQGETFSELRRKGLLAIRDNLEAQMYQDRDLLSRLSGGE